MSPERNLAPKNYIVSAINKSLLTPCRRVGLSRTKKTPKKILQEVPIGQKKTTAAPVEVTKRSSVKRQDQNFDNTPKGESNPELGRNQVETTSILVNVNKSASIKDKNLHFEDTPKRSSTAKLGKSQVVTPHRKNVETIKNEPPQSDVQCTNSFETPKKDNQDINVDVKLYSKEINLPCNINTETLGKVSPTNFKNSEPDSPPTSPIFKEVTVQVHSSVAKRSINFSEAIESQVSVETEKPTSDHKMVCSSEAQDNEDSSSSDSVSLENGTLPGLQNLNVNKVSLTKSKKRKFRLDSDDFEIVENENLSDSSTELKNLGICRSVNSNITMPTNGSTLRKFTTEDYLKEYFTNPKAFQECLDMQSTTSTLNDTEKDDFVEVMPGSLLNNKKIKSGDMIEKRTHKNYVAVLCSSIEISGTENIQDVKKTLKKELTVSVQRIDSIGKREKQKNPDFKKVDSTLKEKKKMISKISDSDEEMFTSSPESDRKQRENLLQLIAEMEKEVKQKEETLERIKQAQVYKKIHSPEQLNKSSEKWTEGCKSGLKDLLIKMQEHGPMEIHNLIKNLRIPENICKKLNL